MWETGHSENVVLEILSDVRRGASPVFEGSQCADEPMPIQVDPSQSRAAAGAW